MGMVNPSSLPLQDPPGAWCSGLSSVPVLSCPRAVVARSAPEEPVTGSFASFIQAARPEHLSQTVRQRSKRMILDSIGVGLVGSTTPVFDIALRYCRVGTALPPPLSPPGPPRAAPGCPDAPSSRRSCTPPWP